MAEFSQQARESQAAKQSTKYSVTGKRFGGAECKATTAEGDHIVSFHANLQPRRVSVTNGVFVDTVAFYTLLGVYPAWGLAFGRYTASLGESYGSPGF